MKTQDFLVHYVFSAEKVDVNTLASDLFDSAIEQIEWFREKDRNREQKLPNSEIYQQALDYSQKELEYGKETSKIVTDGEKVIFSFGIQNKRKDFEYISEDKRRMWLRQHLDDHFLNYMRTSILEKSFDWKEKNDKEMNLKFGKLSEALDEVLDGAYELKTKRFWIEGE